MKRTKFTNRILALALSLSVVLGLLTLSGCGQQGSTSPASASSTSSVVGSSEAVSSQESSSAAEGVEKAITVKVVHKDKSEKEFPIATKAETLGEALQAEKLVEGTEGQYGLFITAVDGETADESKQEWWCLTKGGEMWNEGAGSTKIADGDTYELTLTEGY